MFYSIECWKLAVNFPPCVALFKFIVHASEECGDGWSTYMQADQTAQTAIRSHVSSPGATPFCKTILDQGLGSRFDDI